jgi:hypothetical protein
MEKRSFLKRTGIIGSLMFGSLGLGDRAYAEPIPADFFANNLVNKIVLADYNSVATTSNWDDYYSNKIKWDDGTKTNVPADYRVWMLDDDNKPCGIFDITTAGRYGFLHAYEDDNTTLTIDEGANLGDIMNVLVEDTTGNMYNAEFVDATYNPLIVNFQADKGRYNKDILVNTTPIRIPGDANLDRFVDDKDASIVGKNWLSNGGWSQGDFNYDGNVNDKDAAIMAAYWGYGPGLEGSNVPEPALLELIVSGAIAGAGFLGLKHKFKLKDDL